MVYVWSNELNGSTLIALNNLQNARVLTTVSILTEQYRRKYNHDHEDGRRTNGYKWLCKWRKLEYKVVVELWFDS